MIYLISQKKSIKKEKEIIKREEELTSNNNDIRSLYIYIPTEGLLE